MTVRGSAPRLAVVGAGTLIGAAVIEELRARRFPYAALYALDEERALGRAPAAESALEEAPPPVIADVAAFDFARIDLALFCGRAALSERYAEAVAQHAFVIDGSASFRARDAVPLVAADVNPGALENLGQRRLIALPGSASVALATALAPLHALAHIARVDVMTCQAVSGGGRAGIDDLAAETVALLNGRAARGRAFGRQIAFNVIPQVDRWEEDGRTREERRIAEDTQRLLGGAPLAISVTAVRVPVFFGHSLAVHAAFERPLTLAAAREALGRGTGLALVDADADAEYPTAATFAAAPDRVYLGRLRTDGTRERSLNFWVVADNVRKCAAHNAVSVAQILVNHYL